MISAGIYAPALSPRTFIAVIFLILLFAFPSIADAQNFPRPEDYLWLNGPVRSVEQIESKPWEYLPVIWESRMQHRKLFDTLGRLFRSESYDSDGEMNGYDEFIWGEDRLEVRSYSRGGRYLLRHLHLNNSASADWKKFVTEEPSREENILLYDSAGRIAESVQLAKGSSDFAETFVYRSVTSRNHRGLPDTVTTTVNGDSLYKRLVFTYDSLDRVIFMITYEFPYRWRAADTLWSFRQWEGSRIIYQKDTSNNMWLDDIIMRYKYDERGRKVEYRWFTRKHKGEWHEIGRNYYEYDNHDHVTKLVCANPTSDSTEWSSREYLREFEYDEYGNLMLYSHVKPGMTIFFGLTVPSEKTHWRIRYYQ